MIERPHEDLIPAGRGRAQRRREPHHFAGMVGVVGEEFHPTRQGADEDVVALVRCSEHLRADLSPGNHTEEGFKIFVHHHFSLRRTASIRLCTSGNPS